MTYQNPLMKRERHLSKRYPRSVKGLFTGAYFKLIINEQDKRCF